MNFLDIEIKARLIAYLSERVADQILADMDEFILGGFKGLENMEDHELRELLEISLTYDYFPRGRNLLAEVKVLETKAAIVETIEASMEDDRYG